MPLKGHPEIRVNSIYKGEHEGHEEGEIE